MRYYTQAVLLALEARGTVLMRFGSKGNRLEIAGYSDGAVAVSNRWLFDVAQQTKNGWEGMGTTHIDAATTYHSRTTLQRSVVW